MYIYLWGCMQTSVTLCMSLYCNFWFVDFPIAPGPLGFLLTLLSATVNKTIESGRGTERSESRGSSRHICRSRLGREHMIVGHIGRSRQWREHTIVGNRSQPPRARAHGCGSYKGQKAWDSHENSGNSDVQSCRKRNVHQRQ